MSSYYDVCYDSLDYVHTECIEILISGFYSDKIDAYTYFKETEKLNDIRTETNTKLYDLHLGALNKMPDKYFANSFYDGNTYVDQKLENELYYNETATADEVK